MNRIGREVLFEVVRYAYHQPGFSGRVNSTRWPSVIRGCYTLINRNWQVLWVREDHYPAVGCSKPGDSGLGMRDWSSQPQGL